MKTAFWIHRPFLQRMATRILAAPNAKERQRLSQSQRIGFYWISQIETFPSEMRFVVSDSGFLNADYLGFAYSPKGVLSTNAWMNPSGEPITLYAHPQRINAHWFWWRKTVVWD